MVKAAWERQRLKNLYSHMSDGQLEEIALDWADLTEIARMEIRDEAERRGLILVTEDSAPVADSSGDPGTLADFPRDAVAVQVFENLGVAAVARGLLESAGIQAFLVDGFGNLLTDQAAGHIESPSVGGIQLRVKDEEAEAARELLSQAVPLDPEDDEGDEEDREKEE